MLRPVCHPLDDKATGVFSLFLGTVPGLACGVKPLTPHPARRRRRWCLALPLCSLAFLAGCLSSNRTALESARQGQIHATHPVIEVPQQEIGVDVQRSNITAATGGGLIFALVDSAIDHSRTKKAEGTVIPIRDALIDFEFGPGLSTAVDAELAKLTWLHAGPCEIQHAVNSDVTRNLPKDSAADTVMTIDCDYRLSSGFASLSVSARVTLLPRASKATASDTSAPLYQNTFSTLWDLPSPVTSTETTDRIKAWSQNHGAAAREVLAASFRDLAAMIAYDLELSSAANQPSKDGPQVDAMAVNNRLLRTPSRRGSLEKEPPRRKWVRLAQGELVSVPH